MRAALLILACATLCVCAAFAGGDKDKQKDKDKPKAPPKTEAAEPKTFAGKLDDARKAAKERNVPILVHVMIDGEAQNDDYREKILPDKEVLAASADIIVLLANNGTHAKKTVERLVDGQKVKKEVCSAFGTDSCALHQAVFADMFREYKDDDGALYGPQAIVLLPDGKLGTRIDTRGVPQVGEILAAIKEAVAKSGPGLSEAQLAEVKRLVDAGNASMTAHAWADATRSWNKLLAITAKSSWSAEATKGLPLCEKGLKEVLDQDLALLVPGKAAEGWSKLVAFQKECAGLPIEKEIATRLRKAEADKTIQAELAAAKLALEADQLLTEAQGFLDQKQDKKAERSVRRLLGKKYANTPAQGHARELWPDWAKEEDEKPPPK